MKEVIYSNYDLWEDYSQLAEESLAEQGIDLPSEIMIFERVQDLANEDWSAVAEQLDEFFSTGTWITQGTVGRWDGRYDAGATFSTFGKLFSGACNGCDYWEIYDENGHLFIRASHHDGDNVFEVKRITDRGLEYLNNWEHDDRGRTLKEVHARIMRNYSVLPRYRKVMGLA